MAVQRNEVNKGDKWDVEALYPTIEVWEADYKLLQGNKPRWPELAAYKGRLNEGAAVVKEALETLFSLDQRLTKLYTWAHLRHDEDIAATNFKSAFERAMALCHEFQEASSWFNPELLALPQPIIDDYLSSETLQEHRFHLEKILRVKDHTLSPDKEQLMAMAAKVLRAPHSSFSALDNADFVFGTVTDGKGQEHELTHGSYGLFLRDHDRDLRKNSFTTLLGKYTQYENTLCELLSGQVQSHLFNTRARNYPTCLESTLYPKNVDPAVYHSLIRAVRDNLGKLHSYISLRKQMLGVDKLHMYDMYVPLTEKVDIKMDYTQAEDTVIESVAPLGNEYQNLLHRGLKEQRWVDRYENRGKRSGAYSSGCYDSSPFILMNFKGTLRDVSTLAHEAGHSMHSLMSNTHQPYHYADYPIFVAEVASTFNEQLLHQLMLDRCKNSEEKAYLICEKIEDIRATLFRQTMFAEFELLIHSFAEQNVPLTPQLLKEEYRKLNEAYFGPDATIDSEIEIEWSRIPHFYYNFYVYQYATGISAALTLADRVCNGGERERQEYLSFIQGGCSRYPVDLLKGAGVDLTTPKPVEATIEKFGRMVDQLQELLVVGK